MYLTPTDIASHHADAIDNLHRAASAWIDAADDLVLLGTRLARNHLNPPSPIKPLDGDAVAAWRDEAIATFEQGLEVCGQLHEQLVSSADRQRQRRQQLWTSALQRGAEMAPNELAFVFEDARQGLESAGQTVEEIVASSRESLKQTRRQAAEILDAAIAQGSGNGTPAAKRETSRKSK